MIELACIADGPYLRHAAAMLHSALENSRGTQFRIHVLHDAELDEVDRDRLAQTVAPFGAELHFHQLAAERTAHLPDGYFPRAVWLRIFLPEILTSERVLYLDADMIVVDDLRGLWETELGDNLLGAVTNPLYPFQPPYPKQQLGLDDAAEYFNSGLLLLNLAQMRQEGTAEALRDFALAHPDNWYPDQDALNSIARHRWLHLHPRWNVQSTLYDLPAAQLPIETSLVEEALERPAVIHFIGPFKPWRYICRHPHQSLYLEHAAATPWGAPKLEGRSVKNAALRRLPLSWLDRLGKFQRDVSRRWPRAGAVLDAHPLIS